MSDQIRIELIGPSNGRARTIEKDEQEFLNVDLRANDQAPRTSCKRFDLPVSETGAPVETILNDLRWVLQLHDVAAGEISLVSFPEES